MNHKINKSMTKREILDRIEGVPKYVLLAGQTIALLGDVGASWAGGTYYTANETRSRVLRIVADHFGIEV